MWEMCVNDKSEALCLRVGPLHRGKPRGSGRETQGGPDCLTHVLPRCLPTPTEEADGNGYGAITGRWGPSRPPPTRPE